MGVEQGCLAITPFLSTGQWYTGVILVNKRIEIIYEVKSLFLSKVISV